MWQSILISLLEKAFSFIFRALVKAYDQYTEGKNAEKRAVKNAEKYKQAKDRKEQIKRMENVLNGVDAPSDTPPTPGVS